ncbi:unnamed protein product [Calypogeia fissa]
MGGMRTNTMQLLSVMAVLLVALAWSEDTQAKTTPDVIHLDLMRYNHENSPFATPNQSLEDQIRIAVERSRQRAEWFNSQINSKNEESNSKTVSTPLYSVQGEYVVQVNVGTPPQTKVVIADTGSDLFWLECLCVTCFPEPDGPFSPAASSTILGVGCNDPLCKDLPAHASTSNGICVYEYGYGDGSSTEGLLVSDILSEQGMGARVDFGCGEINQGTFSKTDGLVGLGRGPLSIIKQIGFPAISYCLTSFYSSKTKTSPLILGNAGGLYSYTPLIVNNAFPTFYYVGLTAILVNGIPLSIPAGTFAIDSQGGGGGLYSYTPLIVNNAFPTFYYVGLTAILVNGIPLSIPAGTFAIDSQGGGGTIVDSGTTFTQFQAAAYTPLLNKVKSLITYPKVNGSSIGLDACYRPGTPTPIWPIVTLRLPGVDMVLPGDNLFLLEDNSGDYCMAIMSSGSSRLGIIGSVQQQNFNIKFDLANNLLGLFGPTTC